MASTSNPHRWKYDVFVSFRGEDIRKSFMDHMFNDFKQKKINAFRDDRELPKGEEISPHLYKAIEESRFLIVIFSKDYASSSWCMRELVKILECKMIVDLNYEVRIIFYDVKPNVVRNQTESYAEAFAKHDVSNRIEVDKWREALYNAASLSGWDLQDMTNGYESEFIDRISKEILIKLRNGASHGAAHRWKYDVFVNFRGEDIRKNFMDCLFKDFKKKGIHPFRDDNEQPKGVEISPHIYKAIEESRFLIVIFSKDYASSSWCLRELVKILECKKMGKPKHEVRVIFYDVKPDVVRKQTGSYAGAFAKHDVSNRIEVDKWKEALSMAANLSGWDLQDMTNGYEYMFIDSISREILKKLCDGPLHVGENLVGIDFHFDKLNLSCFVGSDRVSMIGICGTSGIGKTTLAKAIYNLMYIHFQRSCFCESVKEVTKRQGLIQVQRHIIGKISKIEDLKISSVGEGTMVIKKMISCTQVLLVLDDVDDHEQLEALVGSVSWFCPGSLIIFTGKDKQLLRSHRVDEIYDMEFLDDEKSLKLFYSYAFDEENPSTGFEVLAHDVVKYAHGHPLALKVLGRVLYGKTVSQWVSELERIRGHPSEEIHRVLRFQ